MSAYNPPTYYFTGINFNPAFFDVNDVTASLTPAQANLLYLKKTTPDTATALETFSAGILTNSINSTSAATSMAIASSQTDGILNIGSGARSATGVINIATGSGAGNVNILSGAGTSGGLNIGTATSGTNTVPVSINTGNQSGNVTIGNSNNKTFITSATTAIGSTASVTQYAYIGNGISATGEVLIGSGTGTGNTTTVQISTGTTTGITIIGNSTNTVQVNGALTMGTGKNITLQPTAGYVAPTALTMLGGISSVTPSVSLSSAVNVVGSIRLTSAGIYIINWSYQITWTTRPTYFYSNVANSTTATGVTTVVNPNSNWGYQDLGFVGSNFTVTCGSIIVQATVDNYYNLLIYITGGSFSPGGGFYTITRIA